MSTPKRPRPHVLEAQSRQAFEAALPSHWVYRRKEDDYGIDGEVEIFNNEGEATGMLFYVQLKATDGAERDIKIRVEAGNYYADLDAPVLLVRYMAADKTLYGRWFESFMRPTDKRTKKSATFRILDAHLLTKARLKLLGRHVETFRAIQSSNIKRFEFGVIYGSDDGGLPDDLMTQLLVQARRTESLVTLRLKAADQSPLQIVITDRQIRVLVCEANGFTFDLPDGYDASTEKLVATVLGATGFAVAWYGAKREGAIIASEHVCESLLVDTAEGCVMLGRLLHGGGALDAALHVADWLSQRDLMGPDPTCVLLPFLQDPGLGTSSRTALVRAFQMASNALERTHAAVANAAVASYNAGNLLRRLKELRKALRAYLRAARLRPNYLNQPYFIRELAGLAYLNQRFALSAKLYDALVANGTGNGLESCLLADALLFAGEPGRALAIVSAVEGELSVDDSSFLTLIHGVCAHVIETTGQSAFRRSTPPGKYLRFDSALPDEETESLCLKLLHVDPLSALAWFNLGGVQHRRGNFREAGWSWLTAACVCPTDIEAFANALIVFRLSNDLDLAVVTMQQAFSMFGADFVTVMQRRIPGEQDAKESTARLLQAYEEMTELSDKTSSPTSLAARHDPEEGFDRVETVED